MFLQGNFAVLVLAVLRFPQSPKKRSQNRQVFHLLYGKEWLFVLIINGNIKSCEMEIIQSVSSLTASEHIPKGIIPAVENTENIIKWIPIIVGVSGAVPGVAGMWLIPDFPASDYINALAVGIVSGLASTGLNQIAKQRSK